MDHPPLCSPVATKKADSSTPVVADGLFPIQCLPVVQSGVIGERPRASTLPSPLCANALGICIPTTFHARLIYPVLILQVVGSKFI